MDRIKSVARSARAFGSLNGVYAAPEPRRPHPAKPIRIIVPYAPGGSTDVVFRILAPRLTEILGQQVLVDNRPGAASTIGLDIVAKSPPDGYTVGISNIAYGANPSLYKKMPFDSEKDLVPVSLVSIVTLVVTVHPSVPARSVKELIALAKAKPGTLTYGSAGNGSANHLATERFAHMSGDQARARSLQRRRPGGDLDRAGRNGDAVRDDSVFDTALQDRQVDPARGEQREAQLALPELPTVAEAGVPGYEAIEWNGMMVPAGTPPAIVKRLHEAVVKAAAIPEVKERVVALGADFVTTSPEEFDAFIKRELAVWSKVVKEVGIKID